jgi:hypothetical protein
VQVSDLTTNGRAAAPRTDESAGDGVRGRPRPKKPFREAFKHPGPSEPSADAAAAAGGPGWLKPEPLRVGPPASKTGPSAPARIDRLLIGGRGGEAQARIRIGGGALAGAEIRLTTTAGSQAVTAQLLTPTAGSRQTLFVAMEEIRLRLRDKGIALAPSIARSRTESDAGGDGGRDGRNGQAGERDESGDRWQAGR